jgi:hypothetical protein
LLALLLFEHGYAQNAKAGGVQAGRAEP